MMTYIKKILCFYILLFIFVLFVILLFMYTYNLFPASNDYVRSIYAVVIYNDTDKVLNDIKISYGNDNKDYYTKTEYTILSDVMPKQYRKVQIPTTSPPFDPPYNVYIDTVYNNLEIGYFGIDTGGFAVVKFKQNGTTIEANSVSQYDFIYKKAYLKHRKQQNLESWY